MARLKIALAQVEQTADLERNDWKIPVHHAMIRTRAERD